jgi:hypothetical protein
MESGGEGVSKSCFVQFQTPFGPEIRRFRRLGRSCPWGAVRRNRSPLALAPVVHAASLAIAMSIDCYLAIILIVVAVRADRSAQKQQLFVRREIPHRLFSLFVLSLTFLALVVTFGNLYLNSRAICPADVPDCYREPARIPGGGRESTNGQNIAGGTERRKGLVTGLDGAYFSMITMMTVGYGDYPAAASSDGRLGQELAAPVRCARRYYNHPHIERIDGLGAPTPGRVRRARGC